MKRIIKIVLLIFLIVVAVKAYNKSETNGKSYWYNVGQVSKGIVTDVVDWFKPVAEDVQKGIEEE